MCAGPLSRLDRAGDRLVGPPSPRPLIAGFPMLVLLVRHGPAGDRDPSRWPNDDERPLAERGVKRTRAAARGLADLVPEVHVIVTSPLRRAHETTALLHDVWPDAAVEILPALKPRGSAHAVLEHIAGHAPDSVVVLVGHEPDLGKLAGTLV